MVHTQEASHTLPAPRLPWVTQGRSSNLVVEGTRAVEAKSGRGTGGAAVVRAARGADVVTEPGGATAAQGVPVGVCWDASLAADQVVRGKLLQSSDYVSSPQFFSLLVQ